MIKHDDQFYEQRSLRVGIWINLLMGSTGVLFSFLSNSDALLVDGLFSFINFGSTIIAGRISQTLARKADPEYPFGYDANETIYIMFRSLAIVGMLAFAFINAVDKVGTYLLGGSVPELHFTPILIYTIMMVVLCFGLAYWHHLNWRATGSRSNVLKTESTASVVDGLLSSGAGAALMMVTFLRGTALEGIIPISDAIVVMLLTAIMIFRPGKIMVDAVREMAGRSEDDATVARVRQKLDGILSASEFRLLAVSVTKLGRHHFVVAYIDGGEHACTGQRMDQMRRLIRDGCSEVLDPVKTEIVYTAREPW